MYQRFILFFVAITTTISNQYLYAADESDKEAIIVTATRTARTTNETLAAVSVITRQDIERQQPQDLYDLLRRYPGIDLSRTGGPGASTNIFMRGTNSDHTLIMIDGVRASSVTTGTFDLSQIPIAHIERIEIVRGPRASLYGSEAIGGIIHIFTRQNKKASVRVNGGSYNTRGIEANWAGGKKYRLSMTFSGRETDGFSAQNKKGFSFDPDDDGFKQVAFNIGINTKISKNSSLAIKGWINRSETEFDKGISDSLNRMLNITYKQKVNLKWSHSLSAGYMSDELDTESSSPSKITSNRTMFDWQNDITLSNKHLLTVGFSSINDKGKNLDTGINAVVFDRSIDDQAIFVNLQSSFGKTNFQIGSRIDNHSTFGNHGTGHIAVGHFLSGGTRIWFSHGTGFRAPTLNELFHPGFGGSFAGNPNLSPETSQTTEIGLHIKPSKYESIKANIFFTRIKDLISYQGTNSQAINIDKASIRGLELTYGITKGLWSSKTDITIQKARNDTDDSELVRRPDQKISFHLIRKLKTGGNMSAQVLLSSDRAGLSNRLPGYGVVNLSLNRNISKRFRLEGRLENIFDKEYELAEGFNTSGRSIFIALRYTTK